MTIHQLLITTILLLTPINPTESKTTTDSFKESLTIRPLQDGKLHTLFKFELTSTEQSTRPLESPKSKNIKLLTTDLLPLSILELVDRYGIHQLSLSLSRGRWEYDRWTEPILEDWQGYPRGSELAVGLEPQANATELTNTLAGIFCGSLNRLTLLKDPPLILFNPSPSSDDHQSFYHGLLPIEQPCTENLSPLFKLLPCGSHAGLTSLIDSHKLFDANWHSIRLKIFNHLDHSSLNSNHLRLEIEIETVLDQVRKTTKRDWDLNSIFGKSISKKCPLTSSSNIEIIEPPSLTEEETKGTEGLVIQRPTIHPQAHPHGLPVDGKHTYNILQAVLPLEIEMKWPTEERFKYPEIYTSPPVKVKRLLSGHGQTRGIMGIEIEMKQEEIDRDPRQEIVYFEELPWWLTIYLHTLKVEVDGIQIKYPTRVITKKTIKPSIQRERPYSFTMTLNFPSSDDMKVNPSNVKSEDRNLKKKNTQLRKMKIYFEYEKDLLLYTEYSSDANRGFDLNPAALILYSSKTKNKDQDDELGHDNLDQSGLNSSASDHRGSSVRYWTTCALVDLATPDFSMPYNVIIVTSTAMALFFGSVFNLLVRDFKLIKIKKK
ncbi:Subunit of the glycosylphosphatidylinositol transamidase complex-like protein [Puccinia graminis f. sp. tritici]|uniref:Subunit of the glycosylphosphatidylinositol transamidase complex-like protein n=1 Tax=Puccinia graminis f. sp. tritici TaxID=56615 RepID=A0A5B0NDB9_PUCGR|nr:Subunit of the glycosylphosphatidylinositol transamidase complex-like protein [Puccinia graminis f. sp. tritici]